jgi:TPR repeat protein
VPQNFAEAMKWYRLAATQGYANAQNNLGQMYVNGQGVAQDYVRARMWLDLAAAQGVAIAEKNRETAAQKMTAEQLAQAQELARQCQSSKYQQCD